MLFNLYELKENGNDPALKGGENIRFIKPFNLWSEEKCTANDLLDAINKNKIWDFLDKMYRFEDVVENIKLTTFENSEKDWLA